MNAVAAGALASLHAENPGSEFGQDSGWLVLIKALVVFVFLVVTTLVMIWAERRVVARMQSRPGPNEHGPFGLLQSLADGVKLALKEDIIPKNADVVVFILAPIISATCCFISFAVIPFGPEARIPFTDTTTPLQLTDLPVAVLFMLAVASVGVYGIVLAGWSSGSTYPLLGGVRSSAQVISYEIAMGLSLITVFLFAGSMSTSQIVDSQVHWWWGIPLFPAFIVYVISMVGETNRAPFDLPEAEGELVGGFHTEYSSLKFALFFLAEYVNMVTVAGIAVTLFLGGWRAPWGISQINDGMFNEGWWPVLWFVAKLWMFMFFFIWLRGTLPRLRYDQFMRFGWKRLIPFGLLVIVFYSVIKAQREFELIGGDTRRYLLIASGVLLVLALVWSFLVPAPGPDDEPDDAPVEVDPFAGGYPVPPMPGQRLLRTAGTSGDAAAPRAGVGVASGRVAGNVSDSTTQEVHGG